MTNTRKAISLPLAIAIMSVAVALGSCAMRPESNVTAGGRGHMVQQSVARPAVVQWVASEKYDPIRNNGVTRVATTPVSTFSIDVDTAAYANVRRFLGHGQRPPKDAVRIEELVNYFDYDDPVPGTERVPFSMLTELAPTPWNPHTHLLRIALKGYEVPKQDRPAANLVFLVDVSGSMQGPGRLPLVKQALRMLTRELDGDDRVALVVYAGAAGMVLPPTTGNDRAKILAAIERLSAGGSTAGGAGLDLAYALARAHHDGERINRVVLATDGDFNVGITNHDALVAAIETQRDAGISLSVLGFGTGNYNDALMERLSNAGDGNAAYIDSAREARKVLVDELSGTLQTIARDVKIQVEFNPATVAEYRLIGYENRVLREEDFKNDKVDAGDIGAGHDVTALYELALVGSGGTRLSALRYAKGRDAGVKSDEIARLKLRFKRPGETASRLTESIVYAGAAKPTLADASDNLRFAAAVAAFGQLLRGGDYVEDFTMDDVARLADGARARDDGGYRAEFLQLARAAAVLGK